MSAGLNAIVERKLDTLIAVGNPTAMKQIGGSDGKQVYSQLAGNDVRRRGEPAR